MTITIYHHPSCSKSRQTLEIIRAHGIEPRVVEYLKTPPDAATILKLAQLLDIDLEDIVRKAEPAYVNATGSEAVPATGGQALAEWVSRHPAVLQRPIVVDESRSVAVIGRPPEAVIGLLSDPPAESSGGS